MQSLVEKALQNIHDGQGGLFDPSLWNITYQALSQAAAQGFEPVASQYPEFLQQLRESAAVFSAFKSHQQTREIAALLVDGDGKTRSFSAFKKEALKVSENYNQTWLRTEYNTATARAQAAADWKEYERTARLYPNLRYLHTRAAKPDPTHLRYVGITLPLSHPFWAKNYPPSRWNCLCDTEQTTDPTTEPPADLAPADPGLDDNPGQSGQLIAESHPYYQVDRKTARRIRRQAKTLLNDETTR